MLIMTCFMRLYNFYWKSLLEGKRGKVLRKVLTC